MVLLSSLLKAVLCIAEMHSLTIGICLRNCKKIVRILYDCCVLSSVLAGLTAKDVLTNYIKEVKKPPAKEVNGIVVLYFIFIESFLLLMMLSQAC